MVDGPADPRALAQEFDEFILEVHREKARESSSVDPEVLLDILRRHDRFSLVALVDQYRAGGRYPEDRLDEVVKRFADLKLAAEYVLVLVGLVNEACIVPVIVDPSRAGSPRLRIVNMALDQAVIGATRIGWEKLMRAVYYLDTGLEIPKTNARSVKTFFFSWTAKSDTWRFLEPYGAVVTTHDDRYRTPEFHKGSMLRRQAFGGAAPDPNDMIKAYNYLNGTIWPSILDVVAGRPVGQWSDLHIITSANGSIEVDARFASPKM